MENVVEYYQSGHYDKALLHLQSTNFYNSVQEGILYLNNCSICEGLVCLSKDGDVEKVEKSLHEICQQCLPVGFPNVCIPLKLELTALFNYGWWRLSTTAAKLSNYRMKWQGLLDLISETCDRILGDIQKLPPQNEVQDLLHKLRLVLKLIMEKHKTSQGIYLELIVIILIVVLLINKESSGSRKQIYHFITSILVNRKDHETLHAVAQKTCDDQRIFKFGFLFGNSSLAEIDLEHTFNVLTVLASVCSVNLPQCELSTNFQLSNSSILQSLWNYTEALKCWNCEDYDRAMGLLLEGFDPNCEPELAARYKILLGRLYSRIGDRQKASDSYKASLEFENNIPVAFYFLGFEYGKIGFLGLMLQNYKKLLKSVKKSTCSPTMHFMLNKRIMELVHDNSEINSAESLYVLAVAYGLNEMFDESTTVFQNLLRPPHFGTFIESVLSTKRRIVNLPNTITLLHEAATMNLLSGNLPRCEQLCQQAMSSYSEKPKLHRYSDAHGSKDKDWINKLINLELEDSKEHSPQYEDYVYFFDEDIIGQLLIAQLYKIEDREDARVILNQAMLILSKQMARMRKDADETSENWQPLVKALTCVTCLEIAKFEIKSKQVTNIDKMFRRALSCNNGSRDVIFYYSQFLIESNKMHEAQKLVKTFFDKPSVLNVESCQSLALRFLLQSHVSNKDIENLLKQLQINR